MPDKRIIIAHKGGKPQLNCFSLDQGIGPTRSTTCLAQNTKRSNRRIKRRSLAQGPTLQQQLREPLCLCGRVLSAADVAEFVPLLAAGMNAGQAKIVPQSLFRQVKQRRADVAADVAVHGFDA